MKDSVVYLKNMMKGHQELNLELQQKLRASQELNKEMLEIIEFYGDELNQVAPIYKPTGKPGADFTQPYRMDKGKRARQFLAKYEDLIGGADEYFKQVTL